MAATEDASATTVRDRKSHQTKDQTCAEQNGDNINNLIEWKQHMEGVKAEIMEDVNNHLRTQLDKAVTEAVQSYGSGDKNALKNKRPQGPVYERKKIFMPRASLIDDLMEVEHFRTVYHIFVAVLCVFVMSTVAVDTLDKGWLAFDFSLLAYTFGQPGTVFCTWVFMFTYALFVPYKVLVFWGSCYSKSNHKIMLSAFVGIFLLSQICVLCIFPVIVVKYYRPPPASTFIITLEQVRFLMKIYSFLRENIPVVLQNEKKEVQLPKLSSYLYFLFCPTLIYRDSYPRNPYIRWNYVFKNVCQFFGCVLFESYIFVRLCTPVFTNMGNEPFSTRTLVLSIFHAALPGTFILLLAFYGLLHCWLNVFAELLRFADRMFYKDWWNSTSFSNYYRTWNIVIHDWLFCYVYQDLLWLFNKKFRAVVMLGAFLMSASVHEYSLTLALGYFYPVMFCLFAILGVLFNFAMNDKRKSPVYNVILWILLIIGQGVQISLYCQEWYARIHCPLKEETFWELVTPRSWSCHLQWKNLGEL